MVHVNIRIHIFPPMKPLQEFLDNSLIYYQPRNLTALVEIHNLLTKSLQERLFPRYRQAQNLVSILRFANTSQNQQFLGLPFNRVLHKSKNYNYIIQYFDYTNSTQIYFNTPLNLIIQTKIFQKVFGLITRQHFLHLNMQCWKEKQLLKNYHTINNLSKTQGAFRNTRFQL